MPSAAALLGDTLHNALPRLSAALAHADPQPAQGTDYHASLAPHRTSGAALSPIS